MVIPVNYNFVNFWRFNCFESRFSGCTFYIHYFLKTVTSILGISAFYHDSAACLLLDGKIVAAAQEERFTRIKHDSSYPKNSINFVLKYSNLNLIDVDYIVFFEKPFLKFERLLDFPIATVVVAHSPTPSAVKTIASSNGDGKNALAA